jgi:ferredoxin
MWFRCSAEPSEVNVVATISRRGLFKIAIPSERTRVANGARAAMVARFSETCVEGRGVVCRRCGEACGPRAITFQLQPRGLARPRIDDALCTGCGDCMPVCPTHAITFVTVERVALMSALAGSGQST